MGKNNWNPTQTGASYSPDPDDWGGFASASVESPEPGPTPLARKPRYLANAEYDLPGRALRHYTIGGFSTEHRAKVAGESFVNRLRAAEDERTEPYMTAEWLHTGSRHPDSYYPKTIAPRSPF